MCDGREELHVEFFVLSNATETEARSEHADIMSVQSNCMRNRRLPLASLSVKPEYTWGSSVFIVDPIDDFVQDLGSRAIETLLSLIQPNSFRVSQEVGDSVLVNMFDTILDIWNWEISKLLHQRM